MTLKQEYLLVENEQIGQDYVVVVLDLKARMMLRFSCS